eukprot:SAG22_NODE_224_length_14744_cov_7.467668_10_plen_95_part_00
MLAITAQVILVFIFFATILLKAYMAGEMMTDDRVGILMVAVNVPMAFFFVWDVRQDVKEHYAAVEDLVKQVFADEDVGGGSDPRKIINPLDAEE